MTSAMLILHDRVHAPIVACSSVQVLDECYAMVVAVLV